MRSLAWVSVHCISDETSEKKVSKEAACCHGFIQSFQFVCVVEDYLNMN